MKRILFQAIKSFVLVVFFMHSAKSLAQVFPYYNPYYNPYSAGAQLGQQIGSAIAESSKYGRNNFCKAIKKWGKCANGTLSLEYGAVAVYGGNGYHTTNTVDGRISSKLKEINKNGGTINDIHIGENGNFIVVYNSKEWYGVLPTALKTALNEYSYGTQFKSISFNENGTYAVVTSNGFKSNNSTYQAMYDDNVDEYGELMSVSVVGDGAVFCYSDGTRFCGNVPNKVVNGVRELSWKPKFVKYNRHGDYLICDKYESYSYSIAAANSGGNDYTTNFDYTKERWAKAKSKAYAKWDEKAYYKFNDEKQTHRVWCTIEHIDGKMVSLETTIHTDERAAPTLNIDFYMVDESDYGGIINNLSDDGLENMYMKIVLANGEEITTNGMAIYKSWLGFGFRLSTSLVSMRSTNKSLCGDNSSIRYLVGQFSTNNIISVTFKGRYTVDFSGIDTKSQLCYDFYRLADEAGKSRILPN